MIQSEMNVVISYVEKNYKAIACITAYRLANINASPRIIKKTDMYGRTDGIMDELKHEKKIRMPLTAIEKPTINEWMRV